jgi:hypothetical protein
MMELKLRCSCGVYAMVEETVPDPHCPFHGLLATTDTKEGNDGAQTASRDSPAGAP